jgi:hypothetical protein
VYGGECGVLRSCECSLEREELKSGLKLKEAAGPERRCYLFRASQSDSRQADMGLLFDFFQEAVSMY